ncbi:hypothetical protein EJD97_019749 [Solanum chilense]|uniref:Retrotransposon gag domain-containing protein n=1 Tax=Solanum chilense TaxID=4083 RepID=A0A6N2AKF5_SOLCI|nr:hypothetical protein EJD97_019749 [Solanum chilense]
MATKGDVKGASTINVRMDGGKKNRKGKKQQKGNEEVLNDYTPSEMLTSHPLSSKEVSDEEMGKNSIDVTTGEDWVERVEVSRQALEILSWRMNVVDDKFKTLEDFTLEETESIQKELEGSRSEKEGTEVGRSSSFDRDREAKVEAPKPPMFKGVHDAQEVENFLWHLDNYFKWNRLKSDESKINTTVLYLYEMTMLWWRRKESEIGKGR